VTEAVLNAKVLLKAQSDVIRKAGTISIFVSVYVTGLLNCPKSDKNARIVMVEGTVVVPDI